MPTPGGPSLARTRPSTAPGCRLADVTAALGVPAAGDDAAVGLDGVTLDSRRVGPGDLYAALPGSRAHGARFVAQAVAAGARAVLTDAQGEAIVRDLTGGGPTVPVVVVEDPRAVLGEVSALVYGRPAERLLMLGVTGTNGKTTVTFLLDAALRALGRRTGLVGTIETRVVEERMRSVRTTPESTDVHGLLGLMVERGASVCSMEVSSHALALHRVDGIVFDVVAFTNLSRDHLDFHRTMEDYFATKASLFTPDRARRGVVCVDDPWGRRLAATAGVPVQTLVTVTATGDGRDGEGADADWVVTDRRPEGAGTGFVLRGRDGTRVAARCPLPGDFNVTNTAVALVTLVLAGIGAEEAADALAGSPPVPGRMERVGAGSSPGEPLAVVDYAHTPDAVALALASLRDRGRPLVVVLGAGGDRDREKRPLMGAAAARGADIVIVTDDNPRSEDPSAIRAAVLAGAQAVPGDGGHEAEVVEIADRRAAVAAAVARAWGGGAVLVAGKGHEQGQETAGSVTTFDDREVLAAALEAEAGRRAATTTQEETTK